MKEHGHELVPIKENLVDLIWNDRPSRNLNPVFPLAVRYSGRPFSEKVKKIEEFIEKNGYKALVAVELDEIACKIFIYTGLFNLRGSDISFNPVFYSYACISQNGVILYVDKSRLTPEVFQI